MPPQRTTANEPSRKSRRLSQQEPKNYSEDIWENYEFMYSSPRSAGMEAPLPVFPIPQFLSPLSASQFDTSLSEAPLPSSRTSRLLRKQREHVSRPSNAFIIFRSDFWAKEKLKVEPVERDHCEISRIAGHCWNNLDEETKAHYHALADQRKREHELQYPGYKYTPSCRKNKAKKKAKKGDSEEEERCRKLASLVMNGVSSAGIREAMKGSEKKPTPQTTRTHPLRTPRPRCRKSSTAHLNRRDHAAKIQLDSAPNCKFESTSTRGRSITPYSVDTTDDFVPTEEIPHLELSPVKEEDVPNIQVDPSVQLPVHDYYEYPDPQLGLKPPSADSNSTSNLCFWYPSTDVLGEISDIQSLLSLSGDSYNAQVDFTDPFDNTGPPSTQSPIFDQKIFDRCSTPASPFTHIAYESGYFNFEY